MIIIALAVSISLISYIFKPLHSLIVVLGHAVALKVQSVNVVVSSCVSLTRCLEAPTPCFEKFLRSTMTLLVHVAHTALCF